MARGRQEVFTTVRSEGALLPSDFLRQIAEGRDKIPGLTPEAYHLPGTERLNEAASRSWNRLLGAWSAFQAASQSLAETDPGAGITREKWLLPLFQELGYGRLLTAKTFEIERKPYPISHAWQHTPIHLVGRNVDLDRRSPGVAGAAKASPHGLVQEFLNRSPDHLWGFLSNGIKLRILRESKSLTRQAYIEFDLAGMMEGQVYADFAILWLLCHQSRVEAERPAECWLEKWAEEARKEGTRALDTLRDGVEKAIVELGRGFLGHPANGALIEKLRSGSLSTQDYYRQLLRAVYRMIFLFVAEDRDLLLVAPPGSRERQRYLHYYSMDRLRSLAERRRGTPHVDLWRGTRLVIQKLGSSVGCPELGLPPLGSYLWSTEATADLADCELANGDLLASVRSLAYMIDGRIRRPINYKNLGPEELGSVYESLLELHPDLSAPAASFSLKTAAGHERKTSGSYYTPDSLVQCLLDSALEPVMDEAVKGKTGEDAAKALLALKICDLAVGSGHFLIAAAHHIARRVAAARTGDEEPSPEATRTALRDVIGRCLYGVDVNPMAAELCRVNLWLEALEPGKPLSFLDHHIRVGNSLLGATPELIAAGLPDDAFTAIEGDDKKVCSALKKRNKQEREGQRDMVHLMVAEPKVEYNSIEARTRAIDEASDNTINEVQRKAEQFHRLVVSPEYQHAQDIADAWCAAFVWKKQTNAAFEAITTDTIRRLQADPNALTPAQHREVERLSSQYQFFHWHLAFPEVFARGGFDANMGNPPWDQLQIDPREFFEISMPEIASAETMAARNSLIARLKQEDPPLYAAWEDELRRFEGIQALVHGGGRFALSSTGRLNSAPLFTELALDLVRPKGRIGVVVPSGIATDSFCQYLFGALIDRKALVSLYDFENKGIFPGVHSSYKFSLLTAGSLKDATADLCRFVFFAHQVNDLRDSDKGFTLRPEEIMLLNPNTKTCSVFRAARDAELTKAVYRRVPILQKEDSGESDNPWGFVSRLLLMSNTDSGLFTKRERLLNDGFAQAGVLLTKGSETFVPLYEAKMFQLYDHRASDVVLSEKALKRQAQPSEVSSEEHADPNRFPKPRFWVSKQTANEAFGDYKKGWYIAVTKVTSSTNARTFIAGLLPRFPSTDSSFAMLLSASAATPSPSACFYGDVCSFVFDYTSRQKLGGVNMLGFLQKQMPLLPPSTYLQPCPWSGAALTLQGWLLPRVLELTYTAWDLEPFAQDCGWPGPPFRWDEERRFLLRCELDAAFSHLYLQATADGQWKPARVSEGAVLDETPEELAELKRHFPTPRDAVAYIMDTFPIVRRKDEEKFNGDYRTKRVILEIYAAMQESIRTGHPYQTRLDPSPGPPASTLPDWRLGNPRPESWPPHIHPPRGCV